MHPFDQINNYLNSTIAEKQVLILGMGIEGKSTYRFLRELFPRQVFTLADCRNDLADDPELQHPANIIRQGPAYLEDLDSYDVIIKSPGIRQGLLPPNLEPEKLTSQTSLFLEVFRDRTIGVTGTKGKSTTASMVNHLLASAGNHTLLIGNIGLPPFDILHLMRRDTLIVFELSAHQLEGLKVSPHISILLNIYQEHLDHFADYQAYKTAKFNITRWQQPLDFLIYHHKDPEIRSMLGEMAPLSKQVSFSLIDEPGVHSFISGKDVFFRNLDLFERICKLEGLKFPAGDHNLLNTLAALIACRIAGVERIQLCHDIKTFESLEHRLEFVGKYGEINFYNDSIATIPEAVIYAIKTIGDVDTIMLGGYDRGIDYNLLTAYLGKAGLNNIFLTGKAGKRIMAELQESYPGIKNLRWFNNFDEMVANAITSTAKGQSCLLSPAAASYDQFKNFEHRGKRFKELVGKHFSLNENR
ncbi:MAG TPA: UDP-N-acetylmuramoyl-L-alanine--D-glutamate ligase [Bacteroidales bacterium]|nr:UDP-N-acetylmuramoyl-L-alanine--D-glutamate ligase [Bacteroidales bacterium]